MADALISPAVGGTMWAASAAAIGWSARRLRREEAGAGTAGDRTALMGVLGAFVFAAQMINFTIPATGSSGHLGGGILLAALLGPWAALPVIASVLIVQALFFADGGLLALGCNIVNLGVIPCLLVHPLVYRPLAGSGDSRRRLVAAAMVASIVALLIGATGVVVQTVASGITELPAGRFAMLMLPIHLAIGIGEGLVTAAVVTWIGEARPELVRPDAATAALRPSRVVAALAALALLTAGVLSWFASGHPDGLEWSIARATGTGEIAGPSTGLHAMLEELQSTVAPMPDYDFPARAEAGVEAAGIVQPGVTVAGLLGSGLTLLMAGGMGLALRRGRASVAS